MDVYYYIWRKVFNVDNKLSVLIFRLSSKLVNTYFVLIIGIRKTYYRHNLFIHTLTRWNITFKSIEYGATSVLQSISSVRAFKNNISLQDAKLNSYFIASKHWSFIWAISSYEKSYRNIILIIIEFIFYS